MPTENNELPIWLQHMVGAFSQKIDDGISPATHFISNRMIPQGLPVAVAIEAGEVEAAKEFPAMFGHILEQSKHFYETTPNDVLGWSVVLVESTQTLNLELVVGYELDEEHKRMAAVMSQTADKEYEHYDQLIADIRNICGKDDELYNTVLTHFKSLGLNAMTFRSMWLGEDGSLTDDVSSMEKQGGQMVHKTTDWDPGKEITPEMKKRWGMS